MERPSKYHRWVFSGCKENNGYKWTWDSSHDDLEQTETFSIGGEHFCAYCCNKAYPIQAGLRNNMEVYKVTGYCCICEAAEKEIEYRREHEKMIKRHQQEEQTLRMNYKKELKTNKKKRLEMLHRYEMKQLEKSEQFFEFRK